MQLVAYGAQDIYLTGNPQITFLKVVYRRHTNFSMECIEQTLNGSSSYGNKASSTISRNGDLIGRMYVEHTPSLNGADGQDWTNNYGHGLLREVELEIGGQRIDRHYGRWLTAWTELTEENPTGAAGAPDSDTFNGTLYQKMAGVGKGKVNQTLTNGIMNIPLQFWFCRNPGLALPLIALQYHEVKVIIQFETRARLTSEDSVDTGTTNKLWVDYIYLDTDERRRFAQQSHEYLIEQLQYQSFSSTGATGSHDLNFNHPVKELIWAFAPDGTHAVDIAKAGVNEGDESTIASFCTMGAGAFILKLNGHDRFPARDYRYFTRAQVWQHHTGNGGSTARDSIAVYSFALKPEEHQPSGTCNFSRIDNAKLEITTTVTNGGADGASPGATTTPDTLHVYAVNYNVLRIMSGMGGLAYSN